MLTKPRRLWVGGATFGLLVVGWSAIAVGGATTTATVDSPEQLLDKLDQAIAWTANSAIKMDFRDVETRLDTKRSRGQTITTGTVAVYQASDDRLRLEVVYAETRERENALILPGRVIQWSSDPSRWHVDYTESPTMILSHSAGCRGATRYGWFLDGAVCYSGKETAGLKLVHLAGLARLGRISPELARERVGDLDCFVITSVRDDDFCRIWVAPSRGYNFAKFMWAPSPKRAAIIGESRQVVDDVQFGRIWGDRWIVLRAHRFDRTAPLKRPDDWSADDITFTRTSVDPAPDFARLNVFNADEIPDGTAVDVVAETPHGRIVGWKSKWKAGAVAEHDWSHRPLDQMPTETSPQQ